MIRQRVVRRRGGEAASWSPSRPRLPPSGSLEAAARTALPRIAAFLCAPDIAALVGASRRLAELSGAAWAAAAAVLVGGGGGGGDAAAAAATAAAAPGGGATVEPSVAASRAAVIAAWLLSRRRCFLCQRGGASVFGGWELAVCVACFPTVFVDIGRMQERLGVSLVSLPVLQVCARVACAVRVVSVRACVRACVHAWCPCARACVRAYVRACVRALLSVAAGRSDAPAPALPDG